MGRAVLTLGVVDNASTTLKLAASLILNSKVEAPEFPIDPMVGVRQHRRGASVTIETVPSPALLRWLADHIEADLAARG